MSDSVNHPSHYTKHPSGVECIQITEHMNFNLGNAVKYLWRAEEKGAPVQDLEKAKWYILREINERALQANAPPRPVDVSKLAEEDMKIRQTSLQLLEQTMDRRYN